MGQDRASRTGFPARTVLFAIVILVTLPPLLFAGILLMRYADSERIRAESGLMAAAKGVARAIDTEFTAAAATLTALGGSSPLKAGNLQAFEQRLRQTTLDTGRHFTLIETNGRQVINTLLPPGSPLPRTGLSHWKPLLDEQRLYVTNVFESADRQRPTANIGIPIVQGKNFKWILAISLFGEDFTDVLREPGVPEDWIVSIVDRNGTHLARSHLNEQFAGRPLVPELIQHIRDKRRGTLLTTSLEGISLISTVAYAPKTGWATAIGLPEAALKAPLWDSLRFLSFLGLLIGAVAFTLALFVARSADRAFLVLRRVAKSLDRGEVVTAQASAIREVNEVVAVMAETSRNLAERTQALANLNDSLESQVAARTGELVAEMQRREESEGQLRQLQKMEAVGQLTGGIAHDFNNMLAVVLSSLSLVQRRLKRGDTDVQKFIDAAYQGAESAANLTRRLLAFSRQQALSPESVSCNELIKGMSDMLRRTIPEHIEMETVLAGGLWRTYIDETGLENAVINLVVNAKDSMPEGGKLTIETHNAHLDDAYATAHPEVSPGQYVTIAITDTGVGIPPEILDQVFEPFFTTKQTGHGTGLGLSQVHGFIKQSDGHIKIYSEVDHGTTVKLYLPRLASDTPAVSKKPVGDLSAPHARDDETILVVEDEDNVRESTVAMLQELGYAVLQADGAATGLQLLEAHSKIDLLITDVVMPEMNGRQLADEAKKRRPDLRVLFTTGYTRNAIVHRGMLDPGVHLLGKPFTLETLAFKVAQLIREPVGSS